jgi:hypothetical protein
MVSVQSLLHKYGVGGVVVVVLVGYVVLTFGSYLANKGSMMETNAQMQQQYQGGGSGSGNSSQPQASEPNGHNEVFMPVSGIQTSTPIPATQLNGKSGSLSPAELLPKDTNSQWAQLNPTGKGELGNINLLKAGALIGIDTIGQSFRNPNLQLRSEPQNPRSVVSPWNQSTIEGDPFRPPLEVGQGSQ